MFLVHVALEAPLVVQTFFSLASVPFMQMTNTTVVLLKVRFFLSTLTAWTHIRV